MSIVQEARDRYRSGDAFWAGTMVSALEDHFTGSALCWARDLLENLLLKAPSQGNERFLEAIHSMESWQETSRETLMIQAEWMEKQEQDLHLATAHLLMANYRLLEGVERYKTHLVKGVMFLGMIEYAEETWIEFAVSLYERYMSEPGMASC